MTIVAFFVTFSATAVWIGLKAAQQLNVAFKHYWAVPVVGLALALAEVYVIAQMARSGVGWIVIPVWLGATCGCWFSMMVHSRLSKRKAP